MEPLTEAELWELEAEASAMAAYALDEADVRVVQLRKRAYAELRELRAELIELRERERVQKERSRVQKDELEKVQVQLAQLRKR